MIYENVWPSVLIVVAIMIWMRFFVLFFVWWEIARGFLISLNFYYIGNVVFEVFLHCVGLVNGSKGVFGITNLFGAEFKTQNPQKSWKFPTLNHAIVGVTPSSQVWKIISNNTIIKPYNNDSKIFINAVKAERKTPHCFPFFKS